MATNDDRDDCFHWEEDEDDRVMNGRHLVRCDKRCHAFCKPDESNEEELLAAYTHWRYHGYLHGCSHGN